MTFGRCEFYTKRSPRPIRLIWVPSKGSVYLSRLTPTLEVFKLIATIHKDKVTVDARKS